MFKNLREKLKSWVSKNEDTVEEVEEIKDDGSEKAESKEEKKEKRKKQREERREKIKEKREARKVFRKKEAEKDIKEIVSDTEELIDEAHEDTVKFEEKIEDVSEDEAEESAEEEAETKKQRGGIFKKILNEEKFEDMFSELELILLQNNVAYEVVDKIRESMKSRLVGGSARGMDLRTELKKAIEDQLTEPFDFIERIKLGLEKKKPYVILFSGINGAGKTTAIAKVVRLLKEKELSSCVVASDTFRAAAIQQLEEHANRLDVPIIKKDYGNDPAAVGFDGIAYAKKNKIDVVLIDTAGRLQNRDSLMKEIEKVCRVTKADMKIFLGESITGNDATEQAKVFNETIDFDGVILSKADIDEKGGTAISVSAVTGKPVLFLGTGQGYTDLEVFDKNKIMESLGL